MIDDISGISLWLMGYNSGNIAMNLQQISAYPFNLLKRFFSGLDCTNVIGQKTTNEEDST